MAKLVKEFGADADARDGTGCTPMHVAAAKHESEAARILWRMGGNVNARDNAGFTPVERALEAGANDTAMMLVHHCGAKLFDGLDDDHDTGSHLKHGTAHEAAPLQTPAAPLAPRAAAGLKAEVARVVLQRLDVVAARLKAEALLYNKEGEIDYNVPSVDGHGPAPIDLVGQRAGSAEGGQRNSGRKGRSRCAKGKKKQSTSRGQSAWAEGGRGNVNRRDRDGSVVRRQLQVARTRTHMHTHTQRNAHAHVHAYTTHVPLTRSQPFEPYIDEPAQEELEARRRERSQEQARESEARARADPQHRLRMKLAGMPLEDIPNKEELLAEKMALTLIAEEEMERERARAQRDAASPC